MSATRNAGRAYHQLRKRCGVTIDIAKTRLRTNNTIIGAMLLSLGYADGMICGLSGRFAHHLRQIDEIIGKEPGCSTMAAMTHVLLPGRALFLCDTHVNEDPDAEQLAEITLMAADAVRRFAIRPKVAMLSHSNFGSSLTAGARKVARAWKSSAPRRLIWRSTARCTAKAPSHRASASARTRSRH
jgi:malate dehydrogenase (oxaloacetate-decarboxylating)(NADP+)